MNLENDKTIFFSDFQTTDVINQWLQEQANAHPNQAEVFVLGQTYLGNDIHGLHLGGGATKKPALLLHCAIHAREWITPPTCCWIIDQLLKEPSLLDSLEWFIIPVLNVDGYDYTHNTNRLWRKNRQPNSGSSCIGTDLNRNFGYAWGGPGASTNPCSETYCGSSAFSGTEVAALRILLDSLAGEGRLVGYFDIHAYGSLWVSPWGYTCNSLPTDYPQMNAVMTASVAALRAVNSRTYEYGASCYVVYQTSGDTTDYNYGVHGVINSYTIEAFGNNFTPPVSYIAPIGREVWAGVRQTALSILGRKS